MQNQKDTIQKAHLGRAWQGEHVCTGCGIVGYALQQKRLASKFLGPVSDDISECLTGIKCMDAVIGVAGGHSMVLSQHDMCQG
jgi:hypothetical protein